jgi:hypothetical protein
MNIGLYFVASTFFLTKQGYLVVGGLYLHLLGNPITQILHARHNCLTAGQNSCRLANTNYLFFHYEPFLIPTLGSYITKKGNNK